MTDRRGGLQGTAYCTFPWVSRRLYVTNSQYSLIRDALPLRDICFTAVSSWALAYFRR